MKQQINEIKRMQQLAGMINEKLLTMDDMDYLEGEVGSSDAEKFIKLAKEKNIDKQQLMNYIETLIARYYK
jgi:hypothetical protein